MDTTLLPNSTLEANWAEPRNDGVIIIRIPNKEKKMGKIILPENVTTPFDLAEIVAVGPGAPGKAEGTERMDDLKPGQRVLVVPTGGTHSMGAPRTFLPFQVDGKDAELIPQHFVMCILHYDPAKDHSLRITKTD